MKYEVMQQEDFAVGPEDGVYVRGLFLEGARWDKKLNVLGESTPKQLTEAVPIIHIKPVKNDQIGKNASDGFFYYDCPVYKTQMRRGTLSTTGHSTNYVMNVLLKSDVPPKHWVNRGVALVVIISVSPIFCLLSNLFYLACALRSIVSTKQGFFFLYSLSF